MHVDIFPRCGTGATCALPRAVAALPLADLGPMRWAGARRARWGVGRARCGRAGGPAAGAAGAGGSGALHFVLTDAEKSFPRKSLGIQIF